MVLTWIGSTACSVWSVAWLSATWMIQRLISPGGRRLDFCESGETRADSLLVHRRVARVRPDKQSSGLGHMGTHTFRHSYRMWIEAIGTPIGVQQKLRRHSDIRTTINIYGDAALRTCV